MGTSRPRLLAACVLLGFLLAACRAVCDPTDPTFPEGSAAAQVDQSLITGDPCLAPCWLDLIPGESTREDAIRALGSTDFVDKDTVHAEPSRAHPDESYLFWDGDPLGAINARGTITLDADNQVKIITVSLDYEVKVKELVAIYGEPDTVFPLYYDPCYEVLLIWLDLGLTAYVEAGHGETVSYEHLIHGVSYSSSVSDEPAYMDLRRWDQADLIVFQPWLVGEGVTLPDF